MKDALVHMVENGESGDLGGGKKISPPAVYEKIIQKLESDIRGHIRLEHEMKIHMDYLEGKVEKFEKDELKHENDMNKFNRQIESLSDKLQLIRGDRDEKDVLLKKLRKTNENLTNKLKDMENKYSQMSKIEQSFSSAHRSDIPNNGSISIGGH